MVQEHHRKPSVCQQTAALLWKNLLVKWRMKLRSLHEFLLSLLFLVLYLIVFSEQLIREHYDIPPVVLGRMDDFNATELVVGYTPVSPTTRHIMEKVKQESFLQGIRMEAFEDEAQLYRTWVSNQTLVGVVFKDSFSYLIRYHEFATTYPNEHLSSIGSCENITTYCASSNYWLSGFISLQASIDAAIIQVTTSHSVWEEMKSIVVEQMETSSFREINKISKVVSLIVMLTPFSPLMYYLSIDVTREKRHFKEVMKMMGLCDSAFWLSWGLLYTVFILIIASLLAATVMFTELFINSDYFVIFLLFFFYGISLMCFSFMLSSLLKKPRVTAIIGIFLIILLGILCIIFVFFHFPAPLQSILSIFCPFAFFLGLTQVFDLEISITGALFSDLMEDAYPVFTTYIILILDAILYMLLAVYFDKVLPDKYGTRLPYFFFLKASYWRGSRRRPHDAITKQEESDHAAFSDCVEPVPSEFQGKEAVRLNHIKKTFKDGKTVEALRGLTFDIYEDQITAILGHSGAGKTTLLNILSGLSPCTDGSASIYGYKLNNTEDLAELRKKIGVCPQFDVKFDVLTVKENLRLFAKIKGIPSKEVENQIKHIMTMLEINNIQDTQAKSLSGGQKRKLTFAVAVLGDPQVLLLDEPTSGLDPNSRYFLWTLLKERKAGRATLLSTQFMDEADILADRKAVISHGRLKCIGSSLYLKRKWNVGYHLSMQIGETCDSDRMTSLVQQYIPDAKLSGQNKEELIYALPFENVDAFPDLFCVLDTMGQDIVHYGVSMGTLDQVFLKLEGEAETDQEDYGVFSPEQADEEKDENFPNEIKESLLSLSETGKATLSGTALWKRQVCAIARVRFLKLKHERKTFTSICTAVHLIIPMALIGSISSAMHLIMNWELTPSLYFLRPGENPYRHYTSLLVHNDTGTNIGNFIQSLKSQGIKADVTSGNNFANDHLYNGALKISLEKKSYRFAIVSSFKAINGFPVLVNIISNGLLESFNSTEKIRTWNYPFAREDSVYTWVYIFLFYVILMVLATGLPPYFAMSNIKDYKIVFLAIYGLVSVLVTYVISFVFRKCVRSPDCWSFLFMMASFIPHLIGRTIFMWDKYVLIVVAFIPVYALIAFLDNVVMNVRDSIGLLLHSLGSFLLMSIILLLSTVHFVIFLFLLRCLEMKYGKMMISKDPVFRILPRKHKVLQNPEDPVGEDEDVRAERERVSSLMASETNEENAVIVASSLRKEYKDQRASSIFKKKKKAATKNVSFCVKKGEVLGLLGPNGAGKTTTVFMLTGETTPSAGQVFIRKKDTDEGSTGFLGYCAQDNCLWPHITVKAHLEIYAAVRGIKKEDTDVVIKRIVNALDLKEHLDKPAKKLSAGITRKVSFALSMLGNPTVVFLDEPSTGLDPKGQQQVWRAIRAAFKNKERGAILTTHYMEEAEAVCDRVAIMVSGKLRCIGSIQHLKKKFGKGYLLEIKVKESQKVDPIHQEILRIFPGAARQERFSLLLVYKIPVEDVTSLAMAFRMLQDAKRRFNLEEYSFSQSTLQQVQCVTSQVYKYRNVYVEERATNYGTVFSKGSQCGNPELPLGQHAAHFGH
ncbi:ATP-binding cassette sub-family A member 9-like [Microcaecilia unicolor]|uniref:ATP-binding cassette sub-family A member 9-like n=1 Tax=Microcaecilia unicolor TaxID=1415580 RepID=A0A6P7YII5_9AMPH|nr:ATP-binding cassette sub-family A member 9-like [Microcaecilia unicolor]